MSFLLTYTGRSFLLKIIFYQMALLKIIFYIVLSLNVRLNNEEYEGNLIHARFWQISQIFNIFTQVLAILFSGGENILASTVIPAALAMVACWW